MSNDNNIQRLKRDFYRNHFGEFLLFLDNPNLNPQRSQLALMASSIASINKSLGFELYDEGKAPFLNLKVGPQEAVAAVEEFFDIMESDEEAITRVGRILNYLRDPAGHGTKAEMHDLKDDMIVRTICNHFWDMVNRKPLKAIPYQSKNGATTYEYDDFQPNNKVNKYQDLIMGPVMALLGEKYRIFTLFLHVVRKSRNKASHTDEFSDLAVGYQLYRFIMFVYVTTVLLIRKAQYPGNPYAIPQIRMFIDGLYDNIKLTANGKELPMHKTEDGRHYYQVQWYQDYILEIDGKKADIRWGCKDLEPRAAKDDQGINTYSNDSQVDNDAHSASFHQAMDAFEKTLVEVRAIKGNTESLPQILETLESLAQNKSQEEITQILRQILKELQTTPPREKEQKMRQLLDSQNQMLTEMQRVRQERKAIRENSLLHIQLLCLAMAAIACVWNGVKDLSLEWLTQKWLHIVPIALVAASCGIGFYLFKRWKTKMPTWKRHFPAAVAALVCLLVAGTYLLIPALTYKSFVRKYDFAKHTAQENAKVVAFMESLLEKDNTDDENILKQLVIYYLKYGDDVPKARRYAEKLRDVNKYPESCVVAAEAMLATHKDYFELKDLITEYWKKYDTLHPTLERILGIQMLFGLGMNQNHPEAVSRFINSGKNGDIISYYYLGYALSHDMTNWHELEVNNEIELSQYDLAQAVHYYTLASQGGEPKASLDLGKLYADLNLNDSAIAYYEKTIDQCGHLPGIRDNLRMQSAAKFQMGLVLNRQGIKNDYISEAKNTGYEPAILYSAIKEEDHKTAIERYLKAGEYTGYRYIPPIVFEYIAVGDSISALKYLQSSRPEGKFDMTFVSAMQRIVGSPYVVKDSIHANQLMLQSANEGCKFAKLFCCFREIQREIERDPSIDEASLLKKSNEMRVLSKEIPFGYALDGWIWQKKEWLAKDIPDTRISASSQRVAQAIRKGHPAGAFVLGGTLPYFLMNSELRSNSENDWLYAWYSGLYQMAIRMSSNKQSSDTTLGFRQVAIGMSFDCFMWFHNLNEFSFFADYDYSFWCDVLIANRCFNQIVYLAVIGQPTRSKEFEYWYMLLDAAMECATPTCEKDMLSATSSYINLYPDFLEQMKEKYKNDEFKYNLLVSGEFSNLHDGDKIDLQLPYVFSRLKNISDVDLISEFTNLTDDFYEFTIKEEEYKYGFY